MSMPTMTNSTDPTVHRQREQQFFDHVQHLLNDDRLRVDTVAGRRPVVSLRPAVKTDDHEVDLKRLMTELGLPDRQLQSRMPIGRELTVTLARTQFFIFKKTVGRLKAICLSPQRQLLEGKEPRPLTQHDLKTALAERGTDDPSTVPITIVVLSTSGFTLEAHELAERRADRTLILVEPNDAGGWTVTGPVETKALVDLFDPEVDTEKRNRLRAELERRRADLLGSGLAADRLAASTKLPLHLVEDELKSYAKENDLVAKRLDGCLVLFREGNLATAASNRSGGPDMPFLQRVKALFARKGDNEKKLALLSERRASLSMQRDRAFEDMAVLEQKEAELRQQFKDTSSALTRRRITSQLVQLRKDLERRQQLLGMLNQQINIVATHLHNLELVQQGQSAQLPDSDELAADATAAEEVMAELQASTEAAGQVAMTATSGLTDEEQALYEELEREAAGPTPAQPTAASPQPAAPIRQPQRQISEPPPIPTEPRKERREAEPG